MRTEEQYLRDMLEAIDEIAGFIGGMDFSLFQSSLTVPYEVVFSLLKLGEAAARVSAGTQERYPAIPWQEMIGQRNVIAHGYFALRWSDIWLTATRDLPYLRPQVIAVLDQEFPGEL